MRIRLGRRGGYLLSHFRSIIDVVRFNFSVRNGKRWNPHAITTLVRFSIFGFSFASLSCSLFEQLRYAQASKTPCKVKKRCNWKRSRSSEYFFFRIINRLSQRLCYRLPVDVVLAIEIVFVMIYIVKSSLFFWDFSQERVWAISIARLCTLPYLHLRPIDVLVLNGPYVEILS